MPSTVICGVVTVAPAMGDVTLISGVVLSIFRVTLVDAVMLALSLTVPETT